MSVTARRRWYWLKDWNSPRLKQRIQVESGAGLGGELTVDKCGLQCGTQFGGFNGLCQIFKAE